MPIQSWLKTHRKQVIAHTLILSGFLLFCLFLTEPLFDRLERVPGECGLHKLPLPPETNGITYCLDNFQTDGHTAVEIRGWAFIEGQDTDGSKIYVALKSNKNTYIFDTRLIERKGVTTHFRRLNLNLDWSGCEAIIPSRKIRKGRYIVGLYITKGDIQALRYLDTVIVKSKDDVKVMLRTSKLQKVFLPGESNDIRFAIDSFRQVMKEDREFIEVKGWAFIEAQGSKGSKIYLVLESDDNTYVFDTILQKRPGLTHAFAQLDLNLDDAGFTARIPTKDIERGTYRLGLYIDKKPLKALQYTETVIELN